MITIIGIGALGSHVALFLRNENAGLKLVDFDRVEKKNTQAQFHTIMGLGKNKVLAFEQSMRGLFGVKIAVSIPYSTTPDNVDTIVKGAELVLDCTDNYLARTTITTACKRLGVPCMHGCLAAAGNFGRIIWANHFVPDSEGKEGEATCIDGEHLPFFAFVGAQMAIETQHFLRTGEQRSFQLVPGNMIRLI